MKQSKGANNSSNHLQSRISYLFRAAEYLTTAQLSPHLVPQPTSSSPRHGEVQPTITLGESDQAEQSVNSLIDQNANVSRRSHENGGSGNSITRSGMACQLSFHLKMVSMKGQIHLTPDVKHSICKRCHTILILGVTMHSHTENKSKNGQKPWADVQIKTCVSCGTTKRLPIGMRRQPSKKDRAKKLLMTKTETLDGK